MGQAHEKPTPVAFTRYAWGVLGFNLLVILLGTLVRATRSGDGCGDHWPACNGTLIPIAPRIQTIIEFTHRLSTAVDGLLILGLVGGALVFFGLRHRVARASLFTLGFTLVEALIGRELVRKGLVVDNATIARGVWMSVHLCNTFFLLTSLALTAWWAQGRPRIVLRGQGAVAASLLLAFVAMMALGASGAIAALGDTLYPGRTHEQVMADALRPDAPWPLRLQVLHPYIAGSVGLYLLLIAGLVAHLRPSPDTRRWGRALGWVFVAQIGVGFVNVWLKAPVAMQIVHLMLADLVWLGAVLLAAAAMAEGVVRVEDLSFAPAGDLTPAAPVEGPVHWREYLLLTKPRVISLLLFTTLTAMFVAAGGWPGLGLFGAVALGGYLSAGAANAINMVIDRDIDARMERTAKRPTVTSRIPARRALGFALSLALLSFVVLWLGANLLSAMMSLAGLVFYVVVYTLLLKRRTTQNIVIGGAAGCFPPLVGWTAVTGDLKGLLAWYLFAIIFVWTPAHFWALALLIKDEYARVGIPMLPSVVGDRATIAQIFVYAAITTVVSLLPMAQHLVGWVYVVAALVLNAVLIGRSVRLWRRSDRPSARAMYLYSMLYLALLFLALAVDRSVAA